LLADLDTPGAKEAIGMASQSPHALVRIEALGHIEGVSGPRLRIELRKLIEDPDPTVRLLALNAMETHNIAIAGPFLVLRIQEPDFFKLAFEERNQALKTLGRLRPKRCEEVCMVLLANASLLRSGTREETREMAAQHLAEVASSDAALFMLEDIAKSSGWKNSKRVRDAATAALSRLKERAEAAAQRKTRTIPGSKSDVKKRRSGNATAPPIDAAVSGGTASGSIAPKARSSSVLPPANTGARSTGTQPAAATNRSKVEPANGNAKSVAAAKPATTRPTQTSTEPEPRPKNKEARS
jgi:hypothetical protein